MNILEFALAKKMGGPGGVPINNQDKTITQNGTYTADEGFTGLGTVKVSVARDDQTDVVAQLDALIDGSITEISSNANSVGQYAFYLCSKLTTADFPVAISLNQHAFNSCHALTTVDFPVATSIGKSAFRSCSKLTTVDFPVATSIGSEAFYYCSALTTVDFPAVTSIGGSAFRSCYKLTTADFPVATSISSEAFRECYALTTADFPLATSIGTYVFNGCSSLTALILRSEKMCTLSNTNAFNNCYHILGTVNSTYNPEGLKDGYIYVPRALVDSYKAATNWSTYADQIRALEDYTVDGTITGELDSTKI